MRHDIWARFLGIGAVAAVVAAAWWLLPGMIGSNSRSGRMQAAQVAPKKMPDFAMKTVPYVDPEFTGTVPSLARQSGVSPDEQTGR